MKGKFIVFEGPDGSGKTTQSRLVANALRKRGYRVFVTSEPWKKGLRNLIKNRFLSKNAKLNDGVIDALLFTADRRIHILLEIIPMLKKYDIVLSDRYYHS